MSIVVQKYGGSSLADSQRIRQVAERVVATRRAGNQVCVVVSAMGSTTDQLLARAREISSAPSRRELDMLLTCGERVSMALLSMAVAELGYQAISFTGSQCGILTNDRHAGARIVEVRPFRVQDELELGKVVIVAGFQGVSYKREITTLGRGGSDTTAVALAAALGAEYCEICSDVDGVYTADPRVVPAAQLLEAISHDQMLELAAHGAKVLHADAVEFARRASVALWARATAGDKVGTRVDRAGPPWTGAVAVSGQRRLVCLALSGSRAGDALLTAAGEHTLPLQHFSQHGDRAKLYLALDDVPDWQAVKRDLAGRLELSEGWAAATLVGDLLGRNATAVRRACHVAEQVGVALEDVIASPLRVTVYCGEAALDRLVAALHQAMLE
jgi:aspartate kinase